MKSRRRNIITGVILNGTGLYPPPRPPRILPHPTPVPMRTNVPLCTGCPDQAPGNDDARTERAVDEESQIPTGHLVHTHTQGSLANSTGLSVGLAPERSWVRFPEWACLEAGETARGPTTKRAASSPLATGRSRATHTHGTCCSYHGRKGYPRPPPPYWGPCRGNGDGAQTSYPW